MSHVNYVTQLNLFMEFSRRNRLTSYDRILWIGLFYCANRLAMGAEDHEWPDDYFQVSNSELKDWAGLEERQIRNCRNRLKQAGLIDFQNGDGKRHDPYYKINYLSVVGYKIVPGCVCDNDNTGNKNAPDCAGCSVGDSVGDHVTDSVSGAVTDAKKTGNNFAPGRVGDTPYTPIPGIYINTDMGVQRERERQHQAQGGYGAHAHARGLVDLDGAGYSGQGLVGLRSTARDQSTDGTLPMEVVCP